MLTTLGALLLRVMNLVPMVYVELKRILRLMSRLLNSARVLHLLPLLSMKGQ